MARISGDHKAKISYEDYVNAHDNSEVHEEIETIEEYNIDENQDLNESENKCVSIASVKNASKILCTFLLQQESVDIKLVDAMNFVDEYCIRLRDKCMK